MLGNAIQLCIQENAKLDPQGSKTDLLNRTAGSLPQQLVWSTFLSVALVAIKRFPRTDVCVLEKLTPLPKITDIPFACWHLEPSNRETGTWVKCYLSLVISCYGFKTPGKDKDIKIIAI